MLTWSRRQYLFKWRDQGSNRTPFFGGMFMKEGIDDPTTVLARICFPGCAYLSAIVMRPIANVGVHSYIVVIKASSTTGGLLLLFKNRIFSPMKR